MSAVQINISDKGVATVTLTRPEKHNAFDDAIISELTDAFNAVNANADARVMILAAEGKSFSAGADLNWMKRMAAYSFEENLNDARGLAHMLKTLDRLSKPTIARVQGAAFGGAVGLVSCCDIAVGTPRAKFCLSEVKVGLVPATISPYVIATIGQRAARRFFQTAEMIDSKQAQQLGLLSTIVDDDALDSEVQRFCSVLLSNGQYAMQRSKQLIFDVSAQPLSEELIESTSRVIAEARISPEGQQRLSAFFESRDQQSREPK